MRRRVLLSIALAALGAAMTMLPVRAAEEVETKSQAVEPKPGAEASVPLTREEQALVAIQEEGQRRVAAIVESMRGMATGPEFEALQAQILQIKTETYVRFLTAISEFARARGDETAALEAERIKEQILHPQPSVQPAAPQTPEKTEVREGGRR